MTDLDESAQVMNFARDHVMSLDGAIAFAIVDYTSGMTLLSTSTTSFDIELAAALGTEIVRSQLRAIEALGGGQKIGDILVSLSSEMHLIGFSENPVHEGLFVYLVLDAERGNLALARRRLREAAMSDTRDARR